MLTLQHGNDAGSVAFQMYPIHHQTVLPDVLSEL